MDDLTKIFEKISANGRPVSEELLPLVYDELRALASRRMHEQKSGDTLQATALVHEAWLRLGKDEAREWNDKAHFFRAAAMAMRQILVNRALAKSASKRGFNRKPLDISELDVADNSADDRILLVDEMLKKLEVEDPESARVVTLKFFGGLTNQEIAEMDGVSLRTIERYWAYARGWLYDKIREETS